MLISEKMLSANVAIQIFNLCDLGQGLNGAANRQLDYPGHMG